MPVIGRIGSEIYIRKKALTSIKLSQLQYQYSKCCQLIELDFVTTQHDISGVQIDYYKSIDNLKFYYSVEETMTVFPMSVNTVVGHLGFAEPKKVEKLLKEMNIWDYNLNYIIKWEVTKHNIGPRVYVSLKLMKSTIDGPRTKETHIGVSIEDYEHIDKSVKEKLHDYANKAEFDKLLTLMKLLGLTGGKIQYEYLA